VNVKNIFSLNGISCLLSLTAVALTGSTSSVLAQTVDNTVSQQAVPQQTVPQQTSPQTNPQIETVNQNVSNQTDIKSNLSTLQPVSVPYYQQTAANTAAPVPGTTATSSEALTEQTSSKIAQSDIDLGSTGRSVSRFYVGIGANLGLGGGSSALSDGNFLVYSKIGLTRNISVRPAAVLSSNTVITIPVTYDFNFSPASDPFSEPLPIAPYAGIGAAIKTGNNSDVGFLLTGGVDVPLTQQFTATAGVNAAFFNQTDVGLLLGIAYNFSGF
jgi:hypothetical protein